jgi:hypothetical protein
VPVPPIPPPFDQLGHTPFSFYPPIVNVEHNEWVFRRATWSEIQVMNTKTSDELWIPRRVIGELSAVGEPVVIVGLIKELEYNAGAVYPHVRRVIEMPRAVNESVRMYARTPGPERPAPVVGIRLESGAKARAARMMLGAFAAGILACVTVVIVFRDGGLGSRVSISPASGIDLPLTSRDDYDTIVSRFGAPSEDRSRAEFRRLWYPQHSFSLVLREGRYIGALDLNGRVIHAVNSVALSKYPR